jgi:hypothetical protein
MGVHDLNSQRISRVTIEITRIIFSAVLIYIKKKMNVVIKWNIDSEANIDAQSD